MVEIVEALRLGFFALLLVLGIAVMILGTLRFRGVFLEGVGRASSLADKLSGEIFKAGVRKYRWVVLAGMGGFVLGVFLMAGIAHRSSAQIADAALYQQLGVRVAIGQGGVGRVLIVPGVGADAATIPCPSTYDLHPNDLCLPLGGRDE